MAGPYVFVAQINTSDTVYTDTKSLAELDPNNTLQRDVPTVLGVVLTASTAAGTLAAGQLQLPHHVRQFRDWRGESVVGSDHHARLGGYRSDSI